MGRGGVVGSRSGTIAQVQNIKGLVSCDKALELYLEGNREPLEYLSNRLTQSDLGVSLICCLYVYCLSAPNSPCIPFSAKMELGSLNISPLSSGISNFVGRV